MGVKAQLHMGPIVNEGGSPQASRLSTALPHTTPFHLWDARWVWRLDSPMSLADSRGGVKVEHLLAPTGTSLFSLLDVMWGRMFSFLMGLLP